MTAVTFALGIPHTPWIPERVESFDRLKRSILPMPSYVTNYDLFTERAPNRVWARRLWQWAATATDATHLVQLQDDVITYEGFWPALKAMVEAVPDKVIGLETNHPIARELGRQGKRWCRTKVWIVGVGYVVPVSMLQWLLDWCDDNAAKVERSIGEDVTLSTWMLESGLEAWHPIPTIIDHDLSVPSVYKNDHQDHRRPVATWHSYDPAELARKEFWAPPAETPLLPGAGWSRCYFCLKEDAKFTSQATGAALGPQCLANILGALIGKA